jgi:DNA-binding PadR family transcriptional regulator
MSRWRPSTRRSKLEDKGFAASTLGEPTAERGGRRKKYFRIQPAGRRALLHALASLKRMSTGLTADLDLAPEEP